MAGLFVLQKNGIVRIVKNGALLPAPFLDFSGKTNSRDDRGMLGMAFHPDFTNNGWVYLAYIYEPSGNRSRPARRCHACRASPPTR